jgi:hypothetical protein
MKKLMTALTAALMTLSLAGCSSAAAESKASAASSGKAAEEIKTEYKETADAEALEYKDGSMHEASYQYPSKWRKRQQPSREEIDYTNRSSKDKIEIRYIEGAGADLSGLITGTEWTEPFTQSGDTEEVEIAGVKAVHARGVSQIYTQIIEDCAADLYLIPTASGTVTVTFLHDPKGETDYQPVFDKVLASIKLA